MNRRRFLKLTAGSSIVVAGCTEESNQPSPTDSPPTESSPTESSPSDSTPTESTSDGSDDLDGPEEFVDVDGTTFTLGGGTFYVSGAGISPGYAYGLTAPNAEQYRPIIFDALDRSGATVARIHAFDYGPIKWGTPFPGEDNEEFFRGMDKAIVEAKRRDIRLSHPIVDGKPQYHIDPEEQPGMQVPTFVHRVDSAEEIDDFFENEECIQLYKEWVTELLTRENHITGVEYRNDPTIMMWELGNEIEYDNWYPEKEGPSIRSWIEEVAPHVQAVMNGNQLVTTGVAGWPDSRNDFLDDHRPDSIDVCSAHYWPGPAHADLPADEAVELFERLVANAHEDLGKPLWIGEYNWAYPNRGDLSGFDDEFLAERNAKLREWHDRMDEADVAGVALHVIGSKRIHEELFGHDDRESFTTVYGDADTGTVEELRRYAERTREKSTSPAVPDLPPMEWPPKSS